jgi:hypothetical protein
MRERRARSVKSLKALAGENRRSMEQEVRALLEEYVGDRQAVEGWIDAGR